VIVCCIKKINKEEEIKEGRRREGSIGRSSIK
jgi:hypothetical protein